MSAAVARLEGIGYSFGGLRVLDEFTLDLPAASFVTLLGPSGSGKTTILRLLGGFILPDAGRVWLRGRTGLQDVTRLPPDRRHVNMVFQDYALFPHLSVAGNIAFGLRRHGLARSELRATVSRLLALVRLEGLGDRTPDRLSGGQRQRVALARALARDPPLLLLDEPLGALDAPLRAEMQAELRQLQRRTGKTFLLVTHDQAEAMAVSDLIAVINRGRIEQAGTPEALYARPASRFVAGFLGENNILRCRVERADAVAAMLVWQTLRFAVANARGLRSGDVIEVVARPESVCCNPPEVGRGGVIGRVRSRSFRGSSILLRIEVPGGESVIAATASAAGYSIDDQIRVSVDGENISMLDLEARQNGHELLSFSTVLGA